MKIKLLQRPVDINEIYKEPVNNFNELTSLVESNEDWLLISLIIIMGSDFLEGNMVTRTIKVVISIIALVIVGINLIKTSKKIKLCFCKFKRSFN